MGNPQSLWKVCGLPDTIILFMLPWEIICEVSPSIFEELLVSLFCRPEITVGMAASEQRSLCEIGLTDVMVPGNKGQNSIAEDKVGLVTKMDSGVKAVTRRAEKEIQSLWNSWLVKWNERVPCWVTWMTKTEPSSLNQFPDVNQFIDPNSLNEEKAGFLGSSYIAQMIFLLAS